MLDASELSRDLLPSPELAGGVGRRESSAATKLLYQRRDCYGGVPGPEVRGYARRGIGSCNGEA